MRRILGLLLAASFLLGSLAVQGQEARVVVVDGLQSKAPGDWKEEPVTNKLREKQFRLPKVKGDSEDAEIVIFKLGGSPEANLKRWKEMFIPPEGKKIDDVAKVTEMKIGSLPAYYLDVAGTYKSKERPFDPQSKEIRRANYRMVSVQIDGKTSPYQIRFVGPAATVEHYKMGFDNWLKAFK